MKKNFVLKDYWLPKRVHDFYVMTHDMFLEEIWGSLDRNFLLKEFGMTELHWAALLGDASRVAEYHGDVHDAVNWGSEATQREQHHEIEGVTPLYIVARQGHAKVVSVLLKRGAAQDILHPNRKGDTALHAAALGGNEGVVRQLLGTFPSASVAEQVVNVRGYKERTPLHYAAGQGKSDAAGMLLKFGANKQVRDTNDATPFHFSALSGNTKLMEMVMVDVNEANATGRTAMHYAASSGQFVAVEWLLDHGGEASVNAVDSIRGDTPLHLGLRNPNVIHALTKRGANIFAKNKENDIAITIAHNIFLQNKENELALKAVEAHIKAIKGLKAEEVNPLAKHGKGRATLLHYFAAYGTSEEMKWILGLPAFKSTDINKVNVKDGDGKTAVHWAAIQDNRDALEALADSKANLNAEDSKGRNPLYLAVAHAGNDLGFVWKLLNYLKPRNLKLQDWVSQKAADCIKDYYSVHNLTVPFDEMPSIYLALHASREDIADFIQKNSRGMAQVNMISEKTGRTALHWATLLGEVEIVAQLCRSKYLMANVEDNFKKTALQYAKELHQGAIEKELLERKDVKAHLDSLYRDRQVYVDAANAILVGAALIASVTFAGWLQPPLNYATYYDLPPIASHLAPPFTYQSYAAVQQHVGVRVFWVFNSLSFIFAIATVLAGLVGVVPIPGQYIATTVNYLSRTLLVASIMLALSIVFVLGAFVAAGFTVLPPIFKYEANMMGTVIVGGIPCLLLLWWFVRRIRSTWDGVRSIVKFFLRHVCHSWVGDSATSLSLLEESKESQNYMTTDCIWEVDGPDDGSNQYTCTVH